MTRTPLLLALVASAPIDCDSGEATCDAGGFETTMTGAIALRVLERTVQVGELSPINPVRRVTDQSGPYQRAT